MLTETQANYLSRLPKEALEKPVQIYPWDSKGLGIANKIIKDVQGATPDLEIIFIGSMALGIAGQKDIDLSVLSPSEEFSKHQPNLEKVFGEPDKLGKTSIAWHFVKEGYEVGVYLTDPATSKVKEQVEIFNILKNNHGLLKEYEKLKLESNGLSYHNYQIKKYEFYNRLLGLE